MLEPWGTDGWRFRHELLRELAAELAPPSVRRGLHAKVADALVHGAWMVGPGLGVGCAPLRTGRAVRLVGLRLPGGISGCPGGGALAEARTYLSLALTRLDYVTPGPDRDRRESRCGCSADFSPGPSRPIPPSATSSGACSCAGPTYGRRVVVALFALAGYYTLRADLRRAAQVLESLRAGPGEGRPSSRPVIEGGFGVLAWLGGEFDAAGSHLEQAAGA